MKAKDNPFRFERVTGLSFQFQDTNWGELWANLESQNGRGAIVGPCGSGKTTLMNEFAEVLEARGLRVTRLFFNDRQRNLPPDFAPRNFGKNDAIVADGPEHLKWSHLWRLRQARPQIFVATSHHPLWLPTWIETSTSPALLGALCEQLEVELTPEEIEHLWRQTAGDLREAFWNLYDCAAQSETRSERQKETAVGTRERNKISP